MFSILKILHFHVYHLKDDMQTTPKANPRTIMLMLRCFQRWPCLRLLPTCAQASALYIMGGRQWLLGDALFFLHTYGLHAPRSINGLAKAGGSATHKLLGSFILNINTKPTTTLSVHKKLLSTFTQHSNISFFLIFWTLSHSSPNRSTSSASSLPTNWSADQLVRLLGSWTSLPTNWSNYSALTCTWCSLHRRPIG